MRGLYTIHKPTHKFFAPTGTPAIAIGQMRGDRLTINRIGPNGAVVEKAVAVGSCAWHLTGYGKGVRQGDSKAVESMLSAWAFLFETGTPAPAYCEAVEKK